MSQRNIILAIEEGKLRHDKANTSLSKNGVLKASNQILVEVPQLNIVEQKVEVFEIVEEKVEIIEVSEEASEETEKDSQCVQQESIEEQHDESLKKKKGKKAKAERN